MVAGAFRWRATLYDVPETTRDSYGQTSQAPTLIGTYWAEVVMVSGLEEFTRRQVPQIRALATHRVTLRWQGTAVVIKARMKFVIDGRTLNILSADNTWDQERMWICLCTENTESS